VVSVSVSVIEEGRRGGLGSLVLSISENKNLHVGLAVTLNSVSPNCQFLYGSTNFEIFNFVG
jgi:hypothetical protein